MTTDDMMDVLTPNADKPEKVEKKVTRRSTGEEKVDVSALLSELKMLNDKIAKLENADKVIDEPGSRLDVLKPYAMHRGSGGVYYEQFGRRYDGKKRLVED